VYKREKPTSKVDVFSLGCCLFYMFTGGHRPHEDPSDPKNKYSLNARIWSGTTNMDPIRHMPEAYDMISCMIVGDKDKRPHVQFLLDWHPYFWPQQRRFGFICAVGNDDAVVRKTSCANKVLPPSLLRVLIPASRQKDVKQDWSVSIDTAVWEQYSSERHYDTTSTTELLRFIRNVSQHNTPGTDANAVMAAAGGVECYFLSRFPQLLMVIWKAVMRASTWSPESEFRTYLPQPDSGKASCTLSGGGRGPFLASNSNSNSSSGGKPTVVVADADGALPVVGWSEEQVTTWLASFGSAYAKYGASFVANGITGEELLDEDFGDADLKELKVLSQMHRRKLLREIDKLKVPGLSSTKRHRAVLQRP